MKIISRDSFRRFSLLQEIFDDIDPRYDRPYRVGQHEWDAIYRDRVNDEPDAGEHVQRVVTDVIVTQETVLIHDERAQSEECGEDAENFNAVHNNGEQCSIIFCSAASDVEKDL